MITRAQYMADSSNLHQAYHSELAADLGIKIADPALIERCRAALAAGDQHLNTIPLPLWDAMALSFRPDRAKLKARGEIWSLGVGVCAFKAAARDAAAR